MIKIKKLLICLLLLTTVSSSLLYQAETFEYDNSYKATKLGERESNKKVEIEQIPSDFVSVTSNSNVELYANEKNGNFAVEDKTTGYIWYSNPQDIKGDLNDLFKKLVASPFNITYVDSNFKEQQATILDEDSSFEINTSKDGIEYNLSFLGGEIKVQINLTLTDDGIAVTIPEEGISDSEQYKIITLNIAPYFGAVYEDEVDGYFVIPFQNGTLLRFKEANQYSFDFIGSTAVSDYEELAFPMYGGVHGVDQNGFLTYVTSNDSLAKLEVKPSGFDTNYTSSNFVLNYRNIYSKQIGESQTVKQVSDLYTGSYTQEYKFVSGDDANYAGLAKAYREYMITDGQLNETTDYQYASNLMYLMTLEDWALFGTKSVDVTTYEGIKNIQAAIEDAGLHVLNTAVNIQEKGRDDFENDDVNKSIGDVSDSGLVDGLNYYWNLGIINNYSKFNNDAVYIDPATNKPLGVEMNNETAYVPTTEFVLDNVTKELEKLDDSYTSLTVQAPYRFNQLASQYASYADNSEATTSAIIDSGRTYLLDTYGLYYPGYYKNASGFKGSYLRDGSGYSFLDEGVPFTSIVLAGSGSLFTEPLNYQKVDQTTILNMIEYDLYPTFQLIDGSQEDLFDIMYSESFPSLGLDTIIENATAVEAQVYEPLSNVAGQSIIDNYAVDKGIKVTEYSDGTKIIVNYTDDDYTYQGSTVAANNYLVKEDK